MIIFLSKNLARGENDHSFQDQFTIGNCKQRVRKYSDEKEQMKMSGLLQ